MKLLVKVLLHYSRMEKNILNELKHIVNEVKEKGFAKLIETERKTKDGQSNSYSSKCCKITW